MPSRWDDEPEAVPAPSVQAQIEIRTLDQALAWGDDWMRAYLRLELKHSHAQWELDYYRTLLDHLDPFLPRHLQDAKKRAANEALYAQIDDFVRCGMIESATDSR